MNAKFKFLIFLGILFALLVFNNRYLVMGKSYSIISAGKIEGKESDVYVIYSKDALSKGERANTVRKAAYRLYRRYFKSPVTIFLSPFEKNLGIFVARVDASCAGGVCFLHHLNSSGIKIGQAEKNYLNRYFEVAKSRRSFDKELVTPRIYKEMGKMDAEQIQNRIEKKIIFSPEFLSSEFKERKIESIF